MSRSTLIILIIVFVVVLLTSDFFVIRSKVKRVEDRDPEDKQKKRLLLIGRSIGVVILLGGLATDIVLALRPQCGPLPVSSIEAPVCINGTVAIDGSTALQPLVQLVATAYNQTCPASHFNVIGSTSDEGLRYVEDTTNGVVIGNSDYVASQGYSDLADHVVVVTIFAVIVNNSVDITNLTTDNLKDIYNGRIANWKQFTNSDMPITVYGRPKGSGTRQTFENYVLDGSGEVPNAQVIDTTDDLVKAVAQKPGAIGYAALYGVKHYNDTHRDNAKIIDIGGVPADTTTTIDGSYAFWSYEHMYIKKENTPPLALDLINYMNSTNGRTIAQTHSFVGIADMPNVQRCLL